MTEVQESWSKCSYCKKPIPYGATYYVCSVSTCNGQRTGYVFCSVNCFEVHVPGARHRDAAAVEKRAPAVPSPAKTSETSTTPLTDSTGGGGRRVMVSTPSPVSNPGVRPSAPDVAKETLVVVSKLKDYIRRRSDMNTSDSVLSLLSDRIRFLCDEAIDRARQEGRKTVLDRDFRK